MKNIALRFFSFLAFFSCICVFVPAQECTFRLDMHDNYGDGWNDGVLTVTNGGLSELFSLVDNIGNGIDSTVNFQVTNGLPLILSWTPGDYDDEVSFSLFNNDGELLFKSANPPSGILYLKPVVCVACVKPQNVLIENVYDNRAKIRWSPGIGTSAPIGWRVIYDTAGFAPGPGAGDTLFATVPNATISGLQKKTFYDFYVQQDCDNGTAGKLAGPFSFETYLSNDVGISAVLTPQNSCDLGVETVSIAMHNFGANPLSLIPFDYSVNGTPAGVPMPQDGFYTGVLGKDSTAILEFETLFDFSAPGEYLIAVWTNMNGDENTANDTFLFHVVNRLTLPYAQDFEDWNGGWYVDTNSLNPSWQFGKPAGLEIAVAASGQNAWVTNLAGPYNVDELSYLHSPCFDFSDLGEDPVIEFSLNFSTEANYDGAWLEISLDEGANWEKVGAMNEGLNWYNEENIFTDLGDVWAGASGGWLSARHRLDGAGGEAPVYLRFAFSADELNEQEGVGIDDIRIYVPLAEDLAAVSVTTLGDAEDCGLPDDVVTFRFANFGSQAQTLFTVAYSLNGTAPVIENIGPVTLNPDEVFIHSFNQSFDSRDGKFNLRCWTNLPDDQDPANDTSAVHVVDHLPDPLPFQENFENGLPAGWTSDGFVTDDHNNLSQVLATNLYEFSPLSITELPRIGFVGPFDTLRFDYRITDFDSDGTVATVLADGSKLDILVSADCGQNYQTVHTIDENKHIPGVNLQTVKIGMGSYAGQAIQLRFLAMWGAGDYYLDLDNINLGNNNSPTHEIDGLWQFAVQPNPTPGPVTLSAAFEQPVDVQIQVLDMMGRVLWQTSRTHTDTLREPFDLGAYPDGLYLIRLRADGRSAMRKLVKSR